MTRPRSRTFDTGKPRDLRDLTSLFKRNPDNVDPQQARDLMARAEAGESVKVTVPLHTDAREVAKGRKADRKRRQAARRQNRTPKRNKGRS